MPHSEIPEISKKIRSMADEKRAVILAHYYVPCEIQQAAHIIGDSLGLARQAAEVNLSPDIGKSGKISSIPDALVFAGVRFMGETAVIVNPNVPVYMPEPNAGCQLADHLTPEILDHARAENPGVPVVVYVNTTAAVKAKSDVCCTSSNALNIVKKLAEETGSKRILFGPDFNLGSFIASQTDLEIIPLPSTGNCPYHHLVEPKLINEIRTREPNLKILLHPETPRESQILADYVGSTSQMVNFMRDHPDNEYALGTESGLSDYMHWKYPEIRCRALTASALCQDMKKQTPEKMATLLNVLGTKEAEDYRILLPESIRTAAKSCIDRMFRYQP